MSETQSANIMLKGIGGSPGIAIGKAYLVERGNMDVVQRYHISKEHVRSETKRFQDAVANAKKEINKVMDDLPKEYRESAYILDSHLLIMKDKMIYQNTLDIIKKELINSEWALSKSVDRVKEVFSRMSDPYLRERINDIIHVSYSILRNLSGQTTQRLSEINKRVILVAHDLSPAETTQIQLDKVQGFITEMGGITSHTAIIARSYEIPAVLGLTGSTRKISTGDLLVIDGANGVVIINPDDDSLAKYYQEQERLEAYAKILARSSHLPAETIDKVRLKVMANIEMLEEVVAVLNHGGDGIGLFRTEYLYLNKKALPTEEELYENYREVAEILNTRQLTIRTLDIGGDKFAKSIDWGYEANPALGLRAIRFCLKEPDIFKTQLRAILRAATQGNVRIMFPMISSMEELIGAKDILSNVCESLDKEGIPFKQDIKIGIMIEVPSAVMLADVLAQEVDFFSIGTNDLIQFSLAIDRGNEQVANLYQPLHPAILRMVKHVVDAGHAAGIEVGMCGEMTAIESHVPILVGLGLDELSMNPMMIPHVKKIIRSLSMKDCKPLLEEALKQKTTKDVVRLAERMIDRPQTTDD
ncbi:MAG: phosphoenolpyruvate--protein phosphotransferase [Pseudomonadota bacterium]